MLPIELHIKAIKNFHSTFEKTRSRIQEIRNVPEHKKELSTLLAKYMKMSDMWADIDDFCEMEIDHKLGVMENEPEENWEESL